MDGNFHRSAFRWTLIVLGLLVAIAIFKTCGGNDVAPKPYKAGAIEMSVSLDELA